MMSVILVTNLEFYGVTTPGTVVVFTSVRLYLFKVDYEASCPKLCNFRLLIPDGNHYIF